MIMLSSQTRNMIIQTKSVYIYIEENGGKPQKIYIRPYYNKTGLKRKYGTKILLW